MRDQLRPPLRLPHGEIVDFYAAYRRFAELAYQPEFQVTFKLGPGDCMVFDNTRILHARTAFRHLVNATSKAVTQISIHSAARSPCCGVRSRGDVTD